MAAWPSPETPDGGVLWCDRSSDRGSHDDTATAAAAVPLNRSTLPPRRYRHVPMHAYLTLVRINDNDYYTVVGWLLDTRYRYISQVPLLPLLWLVEVAILNVVCMQRKCHFSYWNMQLQ